MNFKKILLTVLATTSVSAFADQEAVLYGRLAANMQVDAYSDANGGQPINGGGYSIQDGGSYFGIRGTDPVYGQTAAIWQVETFLNLSTGEPYNKTTGSGGFVPNDPKTSNDERFNGHSTATVNTLASSDSYLGLQGAWGRVRIGNLSNTFRTSTGAIDQFSGGGSAGYQNYDNVMAVLPGAVRYDSANYNGFNFSAYYSPNNIGMGFNNSIKDGNTLANTGATGGYYAGNGLGGGVLSYSAGNWSASFNAQVMDNVGDYGTQHGNTTTGIDFSPFTAWAGRLELSYNDPMGLIAGLGYQLTNGYAYNNWTGIASGGYLGSAGSNTAGLADGKIGVQNGKYYFNTTQAQTAELGATIGWHYGNFTPKASYIFGGNMMANNTNSVGNAIALNNQIAGTWYQQGVGELDWNITPRTIAFIGGGYAWWGQNALASGWQSNQATVTSGFSHTF